MKDKIKDAIDDMVTIAGFMAIAWFFTWLLGGMPI